MRAWIQDWIRISMWLGLHVQSWSQSRTQNQSSVKKSGVSISEVFHFQREIVYSSNWLHSVTIKSSSKIFHICTKILGGLSDHPYDDLFKAVILTLISGIRKFPSGRIFCDIRTLLGHPVCRCIAFGLRADVEYFSVNCFFFLLLFNSASRRQYALSAMIFFFHFEWGILFYFTQCSVVRASMSLSQL